MHHISINLSGQKWACVTISIRNDVASCLLWVSWYVDFLRAYFVRTLGNFCLGIASGLFGWEPETLLTCMVQSKVAWCVCLLTMLLSCHLWYFTFDLQMTIRLTSFQKRQWPIVCGASEAQEPCILLLWTIVGFVCFGANKMSKEKKGKAKPLAG